MEAAFRDDLAIPRLESAAQGVDARIALLRAGIALAGLLFIAGCSTYPSEPAGYRAENFYAEEFSPQRIRCVGILPLVVEEGARELAEAGLALEPVLWSELVRTRRFEVRPISREYLRTHTGRNSWSAEDQLPSGLLTNLATTYGCDAVLFCRLTDFRGFPPLRVGWRIRLVETRSLQTLWAVDEVVDAGSSSVQRGARRYQVQHAQGFSARNDPWIMETSPRLFSQYAVAEVLSTLPSAICSSSGGRFAGKFRGKSAKENPRFADIDGSGDLMKPIACQ